MNSEADFTFGFRVLGDLWGPRRLIDFDAAFRGHCQAIPEAECDREAYLSAYTFGPDFANYLKTHNGTKGFDGPTCAAYLQFDIDREGQLDAARSDACKLAMFLDDRYPELGEPLAFFSGSKGFAIYLPLAHRPAGGPTFHKIARKLAEGLAAKRGVAIDSAIYDRVRCFRAPNSRHPKTGLHKVRVELDALLHRDANAIRESAREPKPFDPPPIPASCPQLAADWLAAARALEADLRAKPAFEPTPGGRLAAATLDLIRNGCEQGERHARIFRAAGNMAEYGGTAPLIHALLDEIGTDLGLTPADARRQVDCGIAATVQRRPPDAPAERGAA